MKRSRIAIGWRRLFVSLDGSFSLTGLDGIPRPAKRRLRIIPSRDAETASGLRGNALSGLPVVVLRSYAFISLRVTFST
jgi:hypothetical protein